MIWAKFQESFACDFLVEIVITSLGSFPILFDTINCIHVLQMNIHAFFFNLKYNYARAGEYL